MPQYCRTPTPSVQSAHVPTELYDGLAAPHASISPKFLYDALGSTLFEAICAVPEYYPTRTEAALFVQHAGAIAAACGQGCTMLDLGAGNCAKAAALFPLLQPREYVALDISTDFVNEALARLRQRFPQIAMQAISCDFTQRFSLPDSVGHARRLFFYPGSSLGNFAPDEAAAFLRRLRAHCGDDGALLIGVDLVKDQAQLEAAYDDALGVTAAFNRHILQHVNHLLGADFDIRHWRHVAFYNADAGRVEMHLEATTPQRVRWPGGGRDFAAGERIHTENSHKYRQAQALQLLADAGFTASAVWVDAACPYALIYARASA